MAEMQIVYIHSSLNVFIFILMLGIAISLTAISEKMSGRCEFYLANNVSIEELISNYTNSTFVLSVLPVIIFNGVVISFMVISGSDQLRLIVNRQMITYMVGLIIFYYTCSNLMIQLVMLIKTPSKLRTVLTLGSIITINALMLPMNYIFKSGIIPSAEATLNIYIATITMINIIIIVANILIKKRVNVENVILSYKQ